jgi:hypothetical protein
MFNFFFKRSVNKHPAEQTADQPPQPDPRAATAQARQAALAQAESLSGDEAAADFILQCEFADARLKAAHHIQSKGLLERVAQAMRNTDRRVAKLMQQRLDAISQQEAAVENAGKCIREAQRLVEEPQLMLNQVADLDRAWQSAGAMPQPMRDKFDGIRSLLRERLEAQAALQRAVMDARTKLQQLIKTATEAPGLMPPEHIVQALDSLEQQMAQYCASPEAPSLPQHLLSEYIARHNSFKQTLASLEKRHAAIAAHEETLAGWERAPIDELKEDALKRAWHALPAMHGDDATPLDARFDALTDRIGRSRKPKEIVTRDVKQESGQQVADTLDRLEKALDDGALQIAAQQDKALRAIDVKSLRLSDAQTARLATARSELNRLQSWARWGGNISREELLKAAQELPGQSLAVPELAKKVGSLRERWKSLDVSAGSAGKELWEQFDAACTAAYAPAAAHFKTLADERQKNLEKAEAIIADVRQFAGTSHCAGEDAADVDWKAVAAYCARTAQLWQRLGPIGRKEKKSADIEFAVAMRALSEPLAVQQKLEITRREKLIAEAVGLSPSDRKSLDALRTLQERWQERAKSLLLERHDEQALWQRFRSACDTVFAQRKETAHAADADRQQQLQAKEALCATLDAAASASLDAIPKVLRDIKDAWDKTGPVPRAAERQIETRYQTALAVLQKRLDDAQRSAMAAQVTALHDKVMLCRAVEEKIVKNQPVDQAEAMQLQAGWQALPALAPEFERVLSARFETAIAASASADRQYALFLGQNLAALAHDVLRLEILMGVDSPPELSRERLQLQVEVLQSSLKAGQKPVTQDVQLVRLCGLPAVPGQQLAGRIGRLIAGIKNTKT